MRKLLLGTMLLASAMLFPAPTMAEVNVTIGIPVPHIRIPMPPRIEISAPPRLVVIPETYVYAAPDIDEDIFFVDGWWWRPWQGGWYRSRQHSSGWHRYKGEPSFYRTVPRSWRDDYRDGHWRGRQWRAEPLPHDRVQQNWRSWKTDRHWERNDTWGVQDLPRREEYRHPPRDRYREHYRNN
jgi:hypothetical protein